MGEGPTEAQARAVHRQLDVKDDTWPRGEGAPTRGDETEQAWAVPGGKDLRVREGKKGTRSRGHTNNDGGTGRGLWTRAGEARRGPNVTGNRR